MMKSKKKSGNTKTNGNEKHNFTRSMGCNKSISEREVHRDIGLPQERRKILNNLTYQLK